jgi:cysteine desulfurase
MTVKPPIYLDHNATTPIDPRVLARLQEVQRDHFGNPASTSHAFGWAAAKLVEDARAEVASLLGATPPEIVFTSGATEANNLALKGVAASYRGRGRHLVTTLFEHEAVLEPLAELEQDGWEVTHLPVGNDGVVDPAAVAAALRPDTVLVSMMAAQNEIGTLQPVAAVAEICKRHGALLHSDAAQAVGKIPLAAQTDGFDLLSLSAHKLYGPKGVGALYVRRRAPRVTLTPQQTGGGQENGLRAGTLNVPGIVGLGEACRLARVELAAEGERLTRLRERLWRALRTALDGVVLNGDPVRRLPGNLNVSFEGLESRRLLGALTGLAVSAGAACTSGGDGPSRVLSALGLPDDLARASLRVGIGRHTSEAEIDFAAERIVDAVRRLRDG